MPFWNSINGIAYCKVVGPLCLNNIFNSLWFLRTNSSSNYWAYRLHSIFIKILLTYTFSLYIFYHADFVIFISFCVITIGPKKIKSFFLVSGCKLLIASPILSYLNKFKSNATLITPKFRFILLSFLDKNLFRK